MAYSQYYLETYPDGFNDGSPVTVRYQEGYKRVGIQPLEPQQYYSRTATCKMVSGTQVRPPFFAVMAHSDTSQQRDALYAKAYGKLVSQLARAEMGTGLAEIGQTMNMVTSRLQDVYNAYRGLRNGDLRNLQRLCDINGYRRPVSRTSARSVSKNAGGIWLEYWLGWAPTVGDAYASMEVLTGPLPPVRIRGASSLSYPSKGKIGERFASADAWEWDLTVNQGFCLTADLGIDNPNLALLNQMGLANPMKVFYDLMPLSFIVEWFVNFGQVMSAYTDFLGFNLTKQWTAERVLIKGRTYQYYQGNVDKEVEEAYHTFSRLPEILPPQLVVKRVRGLSPTRGATAISLLLQLLNTDPLILKGAK